MTKIAVNKKIYKLWHYATRNINTAFSAVGACINNLGPGLASVAETYGDLPGTAKWILCVAMLLGRLEVFTLLVLFTPMFWRR